MAKARSLRTRKQRTRAPKSARPRRVLLRLEQLEDRTLFSAGNSLFNPITITFIDIAPSYQTALVSEYIASPSDAVLNQVALAAGDVVTARVNTVPYGGGLDSYLRIFADSGGSVTQIASNDNAIGRDAGLTFQAPAAGTYYIGVSGVGNTAYNPTVPGGGTGSTHGLFDLSLTKTSAVSSPDLEIASFQVSPAQAVWGDTITVRFSVENRGGQDAAATTVSLLPSANNRCDDSLPVLQNASIPALAAGASYQGTMVVQLGAADTPLSPFNASQTIFLGLQISADMPASPEQGNDWAPLQMLESAALAPGQGNDTLVSAAPIPLNSRTSLVDLPPGDESFYQITLTEPGSLFAQINASGSPLSLSLYDSQGMPIVQSDGHSAGEPEPAIAQRLMGSADNGGTIYYLKVVNRGTQSTAFQLTNWLVAATSSLQGVPVGADVVQVASGDFNGDGQTDLVTLDLNDGIAVWSGNGDGSFQMSAAYNVSFPPQSIAVGDITGDGRPDLVVVGDYANGVAVLLGNGDGTFQGPFQRTVAGLTGDSVVMGDFDQDGTVDLAVAGFQADTVYILLGNGDGTFQDPMTIAVPGGPAALAAGDFNGDGLLDLAVADRAADQVTVLINDGAGVFHTSGMFAAGQTPLALASGDFNGDGRLDLATANQISNDVSVLLGNGDGSFQFSAAYSVGTNPASLLTADFNNDGRVDLAAANSFSNNITVLLGNPDGTFANAGSPRVGAFPSSLAAGDFTGDGRVDLAAGNLTSQDVTILPGSGDGAFARFASPNATGQEPDSTVAGDFNGDGRLDLVTADRAANAVTGLLGQGDGTFQIAGDTPAGVSPVAVASGDFNGDGRLDLAVADYGSGPGDRGVTILLGHGNGTFADAGFYDTDGLPSAIVAGDFNGDGVLDLAVAIKFNADFSLGDSVSILTGDGHGGFTPAGSAPAGTQPDALAVADFDGDGRRDLAVASYASQDVTILLGDGRGGFMAQADYAMPGVPVALAVGDFTGDHRPDLAVATQYPVYTISILLGNGDGSFDPGDTYPVDTFISSLATGDFTGDGHLDLVASNLIDTYSYEPVNTVTVYLGSGAGAFQSLQPILAGNAPMGAVAGDFNGDGRLDIAVADYLSSTAAVVLGTGTGQFISPVLAPSPVESTPLIANFTGRPDAVTLTQSGQILFRQGLINQPGTFAPPVVLNPDPALAARDLALVPTTAGVHLLAALDANTFPLGGDPTADRVPRITVYQSNGDGTFATLAEIDLPAGFLPAAIASADLTGDGLGDLIVTAAASNQVFISIQTAPGVFSEATAYSVGVNPSAIETVDLNGDGQTDIVVADRYSGQVSVLINQGDGQLAPEERFRAGMGLYDLTLVNDAPAVESTEDTNGIVSGFFTGGPTPDLVALNTGSGTFSLLPGDGSGGLFNPSSTLTYAAGAAPTAIVADDFNRDGKLDLAILNQEYGSVSVYLGDGLGGFALAATLHAGNHPTGLSAADVSRPGGGGADGIPDLLVGNSYGDLLILTGNGDGSFGEYRRAGQNVSLAVAPTANGNNFYFSDQGNDRLAYQSAAWGTPMVSRPEVYQSRDEGVQAPGPETVTTVNGTQYLLVVNSGANELLIYALAADGAPIAGSKQSYSTGTNPIALSLTSAAADLNGDGVPDVVVVNQGSNDVSVFLGQMTDGAWGLTYRPRQDSGGVGPTSVAIADIAGPNGVGGPDGIPDLLVSNGQSNNVRVLASQGGGFFTTADSLPTFATGIGPNELFVDGPNLITINSGSNDITVIHDFASSPVASTFSTGGTIPLTAAALDVNGDGLSDLFVANAGNGALDLLLGNLTGYEAPLSIEFQSSSYISDLALLTAGNQLELYGASAGIDTAVLLFSFGSGFDPILQPPHGGSTLQDIPLVPGLSLPGLALTTSSSSNALGRQTSVDPTTIVQLLITGLTTGESALEPTAFSSAVVSADDRSPADRAKESGRPWGKAGRVLLLNLGNSLDQSPAPEELKGEPKIPDVGEQEDDRGRFPDLSSAGETSQTESPTSHVFEIVGETWTVYPIRQAATNCPMLGNLASPVCRLTGQNEHAPLDYVYVPASSAGQPALEPRPLTEVAEDQRRQDAGQENISSTRGMENYAASEASNVSRGLVLATISAILGFWCGLQALASHFRQAVPFRLRDSDSSPSLPLRGRRPGGIKEE